MQSVNLFWAILKQKSRARLQRCHKKDKIDNCDTFIDAMSKPGRNYKGWAKLNGATFHFYRASVY